MTEEERREIAILAGDYHDRLQRWQYLQMMNVPTDPEKARLQSIEYEIARAELQGARMALAATRDRIALRGSG